MLTKAVHSLMKSMEAPVLLPIASNDPSITNNKSSSDRDVGSSSEERQSPETCSPHPLPSGLSVQSPMLTDSYDADVSSSEASTVSTPPTRDHFVPLNDDLVSAQIPENNSGPLQPESNEAAIDQSHVLERSRLIESSHEDSSEVIRPKKHLLEQLTRHGAILQELAELKARIRKAECELTVAQNIIADVREGLEDEKARVGRELMDLDCENNRSAISVVATGRIVSEMDYDSIEDSYIGALGVLDRVEANIDQAKYYLAERQRGDGNNCILEAGDFIAGISGAVGNEFCERGKSHQSVDLFIAYSGMIH